MDNLGDIRLFVLAASLGSLSAAGRKLGLSPAAASARLVKLEATLQTRLFERTTRQLRLTDEGRLYLAQCEPALQALDDAGAALQAGHSVVRGKIRLSATSDFGRHGLMVWLDEFNERYPDVRFSLTLSDNLSNLLQDEIDLALRFAVPPDSGLVARRLAPNRRVLCAAPSYIALHGMPSHPDDIEQFQCILLSGASGPASEWRFQRGDDVATCHVAPEDCRETNDGALARAWAIDGHGLVLKSIWDVVADVRAQRLQIVMPEWRAPDMPVHAIFHRNRYMAPRVRALLDFLVAKFDAASTELADYLEPMAG